MRGPQVCPSEKGPACLFHSLSNVTDIVGRAVLCQPGGGLSSGAGGGFSTIWGEGITAEHFTKGGGGEGGVVLRTCG